LSINVPFSDETCYISSKIKWCLPLDDAQYLLGVEFEDIITQSDIITKLLDGIKNLDENPQRILL
jgi:hypothetical protein